MKIEKIEHLFEMSNSFFQPTFTIFENAIVVSHKKVGTRFFADIASYPTNHWEYNNQYDITFTTLNGVDTVDERLYVNTKFTKYIAQINFAEGHDLTCVNYDLFFEKNGVKDMNEFLFNNPKEIYIVIRNPVNRFLSGIVQLTEYFLKERVVYDSDYSKIKKHVDITDDEIDNVKKYYSDIFNTYSPNLKSPLNIDATLKILFYIIEYDSKLYFTDIHTQNYLFGFKEFIYEFTDLSKIKIIDLGECNTKSAFKLFNNWRTDVQLLDLYKERRNHILSNKIIYDKLINEVLDNKYTLSTVFRYLNDEYNHYMYFKNSSLYLPIVK